MSTIRIKRLARQFQDLTYDEMMEIAEWFSYWTGINEDGEEIDRIISRDQMAANLSDWASEQMGED